MAHADTAPKGIAAPASQAAEPADHAPRPLLFPPLGINAWISLPVLSVLGFYRPKFDQIPILGSGSFVMNFVWLGLATVAAAISIFGGRKGRIPRQSLTIVAAFAVFFGYTLLSLLWNPDPEAYGMRKNIISILVFLASALCMIGIAAQGRVGVERFFRFLIVYGLFWTGLVLVFGGPFSSRFGLTATSDYQMTARIIALGLTMVMAGFIARAGNTRRVAAAVALGTLMLVALLMTGGRTGLLAAVLVVGLLVMARLLESARRGRAPVLVLAFAMLATAVSTYYLVNISLNPHDVPATLGRFLWILNQDQLEEFNRLRRVMELPELFAAAPLLGHGSGSWELIEKLGIYYPHNIVIEVVVELGTVGAVVLAAVFAVALSSLRAVPRERVDGVLNACCWAYFLVSLAHSMSVGDFSFNFGLYSSLVLMALRPAFAVRPPPG